MLRHLATLFVTLGLILGLVCTLFGMVLLNDAYGDTFLDPPAVSLPESVIPIEDALEAMRSLNRHLTDRDIIDMEQRNEELRDQYWDIESPEYETQPEWRSYE